VLLGIPGGSICDISSRVGSGLGGELGLREANTGIRALIRTDGTLACDTFVVGLASTLAGLSVAGALVGAFDNGVGVVGIDNGTNPSFRPVRRRREKRKG